VRGLQVWSSFSVFRFFFFGVHQLFCPIQFLGGYWALEMFFDMP